MSAYKRLKSRVYEIIGPASKGNKASAVFDILLCTLVMLSSASVVVELFDIPGKVRDTIVIFEYVTVGLFILEYLIRLWVCELAYPECKNKLSAMWEFITSFDSLVDILSIVSILFNQIPKEFAILRLVKLVKLVRLVKMSDYIKLSRGIDEKIEKIKKRVNEIIDKGKTGDIVSKIYDIVSVVLILLSVSFILVETFPISPTAHKALFVFEAVIAVIFAIEYVLRVWTAPLDFPEMRADKARMKYIFSFMSLVDLLSIVPVFVAGLSTATGILKIFKLCKIIRLLKASRYLSSIANFGKAIQRKKRQILMSLIAICAMIAICSVLMYSFESKAQPEVFSNGFSGIYYCFQLIVSDQSGIEAQTLAGQVLSTIMLLLGGCMLGVPVAIIATGFEDMIKEQSGAEDEGKIYEILKAYDSLPDNEKKRVLAIISEDKSDLADD